MDIATQIGRLSLAHGHPDIAAPELLPLRLMKACADVLPVRAAGVSMFSSFGHRVPLGASNADAAVAERLQFTVGEGPCLLAHAQDATVIATEMEMATRWPVFHRELVARTTFRTIISLPVSAGLGGLAALDFYYDDPGTTPSSKELADLESAADVVGALLVATSTPVAAAEPHHDPVEPAWLAGEPVRARSLVWVAIGMVNMALQLNEFDALARLRSYAYGHDTTVDAVALQMTERHLPVEDLLL